MFLGIVRLHAEKAGAAQRVWEQVTAKFRRRVLPEWCGGDGLKKKISAGFILLGFNYL